MTLQDNFKNYLKRADTIDKYEAKIKALENKKQKLQDRNSWVSTLLKPLARQMCKALNTKHWEILGPFGLNCETSIWFWNTKEEHKECNVYSITFRPNINRDNPSTFGFTVKDYSVNTKRYASGTLGEVNGGNYPSIFPPDDADLQWFLDKVSKPEN